MITAILKRLQRFYDERNNPCLPAGRSVIPACGRQVFLISVIINLFNLQVLLAEGQTVIEYTSFNERDPFENLLVKGIEKSRMLAEPEGIEEEKAISEINLPQLSLQGLIWDAPIPQAIIDDRIVKIGDKLKDAEVLDIKKEGVILLFQNRKFIITTETRK